MAKNTTFNGLAVPARPIIIDDTPIYGVLYNLSEEEHFYRIGQGTITEYIDYLVGTEQFVRNGGAVSDENKTWYLPDGIHSLVNNATLNRITSHLMKGMVNVQKYEFDDFIIAEDGELDDIEPRVVINQSLVDRYVNQYNTKQTLRNGKTK